MIGQTLSHYRILEKLGAGGMGEVYRAEDTTLGREVALKRLPEEFTSDPERLARFEREAKTLAALDHPNIVTIHTVEEALGVRFLTMELVRGKRLSELIPKGGMPLDRFFEIAVPLADALAAAHALGIIHRDLKPANIMVSERGQPKVLDFGLAKLRPESDEGLDTSRLATEAITEEGKIQGTVAYMSPEQALGQPLDHRSDIFSLGVILYEMSTGRHPFPGDGPIAILSAITRDAPAPINELEPSLPRHLGRIVKHALAKDLRRRYQSALDLRNDLGELEAEMASGEVAPPIAEAAPPLRASTKLRYALLGASAVAALGAVLAGLILLRPGAGPDAGPPRWTTTQLTRLPGEESYPTLSPDGDEIAFVSESAGHLDIYWQKVAGGRVLNLTEGSPADDYQPAFSPDGRHIAFRSERDGGGIYVMGATGENVRRLSDFGFDPAWSPNGRELAVSAFSAGDPTRIMNQGLWIVDAETGESRPLLAGKGLQPRWSPNGWRVAFWDLVAGGRRDIFTVSIDGSSAVAVTEDAAFDWSPTWSADGQHLFFSSDRDGSFNIWRVAIDERTGEVLGSLESVTTGEANLRGYLSLSRDGRRLAYASRLKQTNLQRIAFDPQAEALGAEPEPVTRGSRSLGWYLGVAGPEDWIVFSTTAPREDLHVTRGDGTGERQITDDPFRDRGGQWSPDGKRIAFYSDRGGSYQIWTVRADGSGLTQVTSMQDQDLMYPLWSPDSDRMVFSSFTDARTFLLDLTLPIGDTNPQTLPPVSEGTGLMAKSWSTDGAWLAGDRRPADGSLSGVSVYSFASRQYHELTDFSDALGGFPTWLSDSRRLLFVYQGNLFLADRETKNWRQLLSVRPDRILSAHPSPDNRWIYLIRETSEGDIWLLSQREGS